MYSRQLTNKQQSVLETEKERFATIFLGRAKKKQSGKKAETKLLRKQVKLSDNHEMKFIVDHKINV